VRQLPHGHRDVDGANGLPHVAGLAPSEELQGHLHVLPKQVDPACKMAVESPFCAPERRERRHFAGYLWNSSSEYFIHSKP
jgi:hypothetical protein